MEFLELITASSPLLCAADCNQISEPPQIQIPSTTTQSNIQSNIPTPQPKNTNTQELDISLQLFLNPTLYQLLNIIPRSPSKPPMKKRRLRRA